MSIGYWFKWLHGGGNFGLIARSVTSFHETLLKNHIHRIPDYKTLLILVAMMDANVYISRNEISIESILFMVDSILNPFAEEALTFPVDGEIRLYALKDLVLMLEIMELDVDTPELNTMQIGNVVQGKMDLIHKNIERILELYRKGKTERTHDEFAAYWMNSSDTENLRNELGIC